MSAATFAEALRGTLPLKIREVQWTDPTLTLAGDGWSLSVTCPWRVVDRGGLLFSWSSADAEDRVWDLAGEEVLAIEPRPASIYRDPILRLTGGLVLELFSDSPIDPWTLRLPQVTFVGPLAHNDWGA